MILITLQASSVSGDSNPVTSSTDVNFSPNDVAAMTSLTCFNSTGTPNTAFAGIIGIVTVDANNVPNEQTFPFDFNTEPPNFPVTAMFPENAETITFAVGASAAGGGLFSGSNFADVSGVIQIIFDQFI